MTSVDSSALGMTYLLLDHGCYAVWGCQLGNIEDEHVLVERVASVLDSLRARAERRMNV